jgi:hypothetical protein
VLPPEPGLFGRLSKTGVEESEPSQAQSAAAARRMSNEERLKIGSFMG